MRTLDDRRGDALLHLEHVPWPLKEPTIAVVYALLAIAEAIERQERTS